MKEEEEEREMTVNWSRLRLLLAVKADAYLNEWRRDRRFMCLVLTVLCGHRYH